jgi:hypothetical protein
MEDEPIKEVWYVNVIGPAGEVRVLGREVAKLPGWALREEDGTLQVGFRDAGPDDTPEEAQARTEHLLWHLNWALMIEGLGELSALKCGGMFRVSADGTTHKMILAEGVHYEFSVGGMILRGPGDEDRMLKRISALAVLRADKGVNEALEMFRAGRDDWAKLYSIIEIVVRDRGRDVAPDWISRSELTRLKHTANDHRAGGVTARHHAPTFDPPAKPMPIEEAQGHVRRILDRFIEERAAKRASVDDDEAR